jgi:DNA-binding IclR family transcriptional regulator
MEWKLVEDQERMYRILGYSGSLKLLRCLQNGGKPFSEIMHETKMNPGIINRLKRELTSINAIGYDGYNYYITQFGREAIEFGDSVKICKVVS